MSSTAQLDAELNQAILSGKVLEAFEKYYADDVVMMENNTRYEGKEVNRKREIEFFGKVQEFHGVELVGSAVNGDRSYSEWVYEVTLKGAPRMRLEQVAARQWKDGKLVFERFYFKG